jgi:hypothetical protein
MYSFHIVILLAFASFYYKAADYENEAPFLWGGASILVYMLTWFGFSWGWLGCIIGQVILFVAITVMRTLRK